MPSIIVRPDLPVDIYPLKAVVRVNRGAHGFQLSRAIREQGGMFVRAVAKEGYEFMDSYGMKILGGPFPVLRPKPLPKPSRTQLRKGPHDRGARVPPDVSFTVDVVPVAVADEVEYLIGGLFKHRQVQTEMLDTDLVTMIANKQARRTNGR